MATTFITTNTISAGTTVTLANGDGALIAPGIVLGSTNGIALVGVASNHQVTVLGTVHGNNFGIYLGEMTPRSTPDSRWWLVRAGSSVQGTPPCS